MSREVCNHFRPIEDFCQNCHEPDQFEDVAVKEPYVFKTLTHLNNPEKYKDGFAIKDSGQRQSFAGGMVRDVQTGKIQYTRVLDGPMLDRWAEHITKASSKYPDVAPGVANWTLASGPEELQRFKESAFRHFRQWLRGDIDEDHAAAVFFNINGYEYLKAKQAGK